MKVHTVWGTHHSDLSSSGLAFIPYDPIVSDDDWGEKRELAEQVATTSYSMGCRSSKKLGLNELDSKLKRAGDIPYRMTRSTSRARVRVSIR